MRIQSKGNSGQEKRVEHLKLRGGRLVTKKATDIFEYANRNWSRSK